MEDTNPFYLQALNIRGLIDNRKRGNVFQWLKTNECEVGIDPNQNIKMGKPSIFILTDTHCRWRRQARAWAKEWSNDPNDSIWSLGTSHRKGIAILISQDFKMQNPDYKISHKVIDPNGRYIKCILTINDYQYRILGVYAPTNPLERIKFFIDIVDLMDDGQDDVENISGGDWNCTFDDILDRLNCTSQQNDSGRIHLKRFLDIFNMEDVWRRRNPETEEYTWTGQGKFSRIDFWLTSISLSSQIDRVFHCFAPYTDHSAINIVLNTEKINRGKGSWKMNADHLLKKDYREGLIKLLVCICVQI